jgi:hypothetical protein
MEYLKRTYIADNFRQNQIFNQRGIIAGVGTLVTVPQLGYDEAP